MKKHDFQLNYKKKIITSIFLEILSWKINLFHEKTAWIKTCLQETLPDVTGVCMYPTSLLLQSKKSNICVC